MQMAEAIGLLGLEAGDDLGKLRQKYHARMRAVHPDVAGQERGTPLSQRLNEAYALVRENWPPAVFPAKGRLPVPENPLALTERTVWMVDAPFGEEILLEMARGRYYWEERQEPFPLFLKSVREASLSLANGVFLSERERIALFHWLVQCFVDPLPCLNSLAGEGRVAKEGEDYRIRSHLLYWEGEMPAHLPVRVESSRILAGGGEKEPIREGQVSFAEDSLFYVVTPLLVQGVMEGELFVPPKAAAGRGKREAVLTLHPTGKKWENPTGKVNEKIRQLLGA